MRPPDAPGPSRVLGRRFPLSAKLCVADLSASVGTPAEPLSVNDYARAAASRETLVAPPKSQMHGSLAGHRPRAFITQCLQVNALEEMFSAAEQHRAQGQRELIDEPFT